MAGITLSSTHPYPVGTTVYAYEDVGQMPGNYRPPDEPNASAVVAANSSLTVTGLIEGGRYYLVGQVASVWRWVSVYTHTDAEPSPETDIAGAIAAHVADTTNVHGIADTATLLGRPINVLDHEADPDDSGNNAVAFQAAINAAVADGSRCIYIPPGTYRISNTVYVPSEFAVFGAGPMQTAIRRTADVLIFDCRNGTTAGAAKEHSLCRFEGLHFYKTTGDAGTAYCIDTDGSNMDVIARCVFGQVSSAGTPQGIYAGSSGVLRVYDSNFTYSEGGDKNAIKIVGSNGVYIDKCQFEGLTLGSFIDVDESIDVRISQSHFESTRVSFKNSRGCSIRDSYAYGTTVFFDSRCADNVVESLLGASLRAVDLGQTEYRHTNFTSHGNELQRVNFHPDESPLRPRAHGTAYNSTYLHTYPAGDEAGPGDVLLFCVTARNGLDLASTTSTIKFVNTADGSTLHESPSFTLDGYTVGGSSAHIEKIVYWYALVVPTGGKISLQSAGFILSAWCGKALNANPLLTTTSVWDGTTVSGTFSQVTNVTPSMSGGGKYQMTPHASSAWSVLQQSTPIDVGTRYLFFVKGRWADAQPLRIGIGGDVAVSSDSGRKVQAEYKAGDSAYNLAYPTDKMMIAVSPLFVHSGSVRASFGGNAGFANTSAIELDAAAIVPLQGIPRGDNRPALVTVPSAAELTLPTTGEVFIVSGTTTITSITASWPGRRVTLIFSGALTLTDGGNLKMGGNFVTTADDAIPFVFDGTNWIESAGRSVN